MLFKRFVSILASSLGALGVAACIAGIYAVWLLSARLTLANEKVFATVDKALISTQDRLRGVQKRVADSKIPTSEITKWLRDWSTRKVEERVISQLDIEKRANELAQYLHTADSWLETSAESVQGIKQLLELGKTAGGRVDPASLNAVVEKLALLRNAVQKTERAVDEIREFADVKVDDAGEKRLAGAKKLLARVVLTIVDIDSRLDEAVTRLGELQSDAQDLKARTSNDILFATVGCYVVLAWIAAGQIALCAWGFSR